MGDYQTMYLTSKKQVMSVTWQCLLMKVRLSILRFVPDQILKTWQCQLQSAMASYKIQKHGFFQYFEIITSQSV